jgi:SAM-dependent methyltransferase
VADQSIADVHQVRQLFDAKAATWAQKYAPDGKLADRVRVFYAALGRHVPPGGRVLDLGCATGELARVAAAAGYSVTACDISEQMLRRAVAGDQDNAVAWVPLDPCWQDLPFASAGFDAVVASSVLEYVDEPAAVLRECARVLRPGGVVLCTVPDNAHPVRWLEWLVGLLGQVPQVRSAGRRWPLLGRYLVYLQVSRHRHSARWWHAIAATARLSPVPGAAGQTRRPVRRPPLRLHAFLRPDDLTGAVR